MKKVNSIKIIMLLMGISFFLSTCKKPEDEIPPSLNVNPTTKEIDQNTGNFNVSVTSTVAWTASCDKNWITLEPLSGIGNGTVKADFQANAATTPRTANIIFKGVNVEDRIVSVTQSGIQPILTITPALQNVSVDAGSTTINIVSNLSWSVSSDQTWCTLAQSSGTGNASLTVNYLTNKITSPRTATITFTANGVSSQTVLITQAEFIPVLLVTPSSKTVNSIAESATYTITSNIPWTAACGESWLTISNPNGSNNATLTVNYEQNATIATRVASIVVSGNGIASQTVTLMQTNIIPTLTVTPENKDVTSPAGSTTFEITNNTTWSAQSDQTWCTITNATGNGNATLNVNYEENTQAIQRVANLTIVVNGVPNKIATVTQAPVISQIWNMSNEYSTNSNPNGVWSYGRKSPVNSDNFDIMPYRFTESGGRLFWIFGSGTWYPSIYSGPTMWVNDNSNGLPCVRWTCPETGNYSLNSTFTGVDSRGMDVIVYIIKNGTIIFTDQIQAYNGTANYTSNNFSLQKNDHLDFSIKWNGGGSAGDASNTGVQAIITK